MSEQKFPSPLEVTWVINQDIGNNTSTINIVSVPSRGNMGY